MLPEPASLDAVFAALDASWSPVVVADLNGQQVKAVRLHGEFHWHAHAREDELFLVRRGTLEMHFRDRVVTLREGELLVVPAGVEHKPVAPEEVEVLLFEPASTVREGDA